ncbi:hypothetical protein HNP48_002758 [Acidovorax soli]|uniref:Uncharacterized protein n=1 Tax=Acidovorax soli TaxID=592050 RepID=A0A7X0U9E5_9BURK|nr:hypothetical protein [Acidovorax soli]MBB6560086.1 hypothetical protein [Acidovorax soli]
MSSIAGISLAAVLMGLVASVKLGRASRLEGLGSVVVLLFPAIFLGIGQFIGVAVLHAACAGIDVCDPTTDHTVWSLGYPLLAVPLNWLVMLLTPAAVQQEEETSE